MSFYVKFWVLFFKDYFNIRVMMIIFALLRLVNDYITLI